MRLSHLCRYVGVLLTAGIHSVSAAGRLRRKKAHRIRTTNDFATRYWSLNEIRENGLNEELEAGKDTIDEQIDQEVDLLEMMEVMAGFDAFSMVSTPAPSPSPTITPSDTPTVAPSPSPTITPSDTPTAVHSQEPTVSNMPSQVPTSKGTGTNAPSISVEPSSKPSVSIAPSNTPSVSIQPSSTPTVSIRPSMTPSISAQPSSLATLEVSTPKPSISSVPTLLPSFDPTSRPSLAPTTSPSFAPTQAPSNLPTRSPTLSPSTHPTNLPTVSPTISVAPSSPPSPAPTSSPTLASCNVTPEERALGILQALDLIADPSLIRNGSTSQGMATNWIINQDIRRLCADDEKLVQRWVMAVIYFSTGGSEWNQCSAVGSDSCGAEFPFVNKRRFLSPNSECQWAGVTCNAQACITEIEFGKITAVVERMYIVPVIDSLLLHRLLLDPMKRKTTLLVPFLLKSASCQSLPFGVWSEVNSLAQFLPKLATWPT
jgi:hypothetical protein